MFPPTFIYYYQEGNIVLSPGQSRERLPARVDVDPRPWLAARGTLRPGGRFLEAVR